MNVVIFYIERVADLLQSDQIFVSMPIDSILNMGILTNLR